MARVRWDETAGTAAPLPVRRPQALSHFWFHAAPHEARVHWHPEFHRTVPCVDSCPHCGDGLPTRREGFAPAAVWLPGRDGAGPTWMSLVLELAPSLLDLLARFAPVAGRVLTIEVKREGSFRRYAVRSADQFKPGELPRLAPFDVRGPVEAHWGLTSPVADSPATADDDGATLPFRRAVAG